MRLPKRAVPTRTSVTFPSASVAMAAELRPSHRPHAGSGRKKTALVCGAGGFIGSHLTDRFLAEAHPKLRPVDTTSDGIFLAGTCQGPRDISETVCQGSGAAARVIRLLTDLTGKS